jgi:hypothetical protein
VAQSRRLARFIAVVRTAGRWIGRSYVLDLFCRGRHAGGMALRDEVVSAIRFVLRLRLGRRLQRALGVREETDAHILAEQIVDHLERCRFRFSQEPPPTAHGTPETRADGSGRRPRR